MIQLILSDIFHGAHSLFLVKIQYVVFRVTGLDSINHGPQLKLEWFQAVRRFIIRVFFSLEGEIRCSQHATVTSLGNIRVRQFQRLFNFRCLDEKVLGSQAFRTKRNRREMESGTGTYDRQKAGQKIKNKKDDA